MQITFHFLPLIALDLAAPQVTLTLDNECTYGCQSISIGGVCNTLSNCMSEYRPPGGADIGADITCDFYRNWRCEGDPWAFGVGDGVCFTDFPFIEVSVKCYVI